MKKKISIISMTALLVASTAYGSGYRIPEQSLNATALANAYVAHTEAADAAYYNPANMSFLGDGWLTEASLMYINLPSIDYTSTTGVVSSNSENFFIPEIFVVSPDYNKFRFGIAVTTPVGLTKRWDAPAQKASTEEFTLKTLEFNPTLSYQFCNKFSGALGARIIYASGVVKSFATIPGVGEFSRDLEGDTVDYGYNLALSYKLDDSWAFGATYRSKIELGVEGDARIVVGAPLYNSNTAVDLPVPAVLTIGASYTFAKTTIEVNYDKTYWSSYDQLDFNYDNDLTTLVPDPLVPLVGKFENPISKSWSDSDAFRIGITHKCTDRLTTMIGFAIDESPVPDKTLGYELPDSDAKLYSIGFRYKVSEMLEVGAAYLLDIKDKRTLVAGANDQGIDGEFSEGGAHLVNIGASYSY